MNHQDWERGKRDHRGLGDTAAKDYDLKHHTTFGTGQYMAFEQAKIADCLQCLGEKVEAVDIGSGTGRNSLLLADHFQNVIGYDFSPNSVNVANKNKAEKEAHNVSFKIRDVDEEGLPQQDETVDFICASFGMGSFFFSLSFLLSEISRVLKPNGYCILSFYNRNALSSLVKDFSTVEPSLAAKVNTKEEKLSVKYNDKEYIFPVRPYSVQQVRSALDNFMSTDNIYTYPVIPTILSDDLFKAKNLRDVVSNIDDFMSDTSRCEYGAYILAIARKPKPSSSKAHGFGGAHRIIKKFDLLDQLRLHAPILSVEDALASGGDDTSFTASNMVKTIVVANVQGNKLKLVAVCIRGEQKLDIRKLSDFLGTSRSALRFATDIEIEKNLGFKLGAIPPYGLRGNTPLVSDESIRHLTTIWCGTGSPIESLKISMQEFQKVTQTKFADLSKDSIIKNGTHSPQ